MYGILAWVQVSGASNSRGFLPSQRRRILGIEAWGWRHDSSLVCISHSIARGHPCVPGKLPHFVITLNDEREPSG